MAFTDLNLNYVSFNHIRYLNNTIYYGILIGNNIIMNRELREAFSVEVVIYRISANNKIEYLMFKRDESRGSFWNYLTGGIKRGEMPVYAAIREIQEESQLPIESIKFCNYVRSFNIDKKVRKAFRECVNKCYGFCYIAKTGQVNPILNEEHVDYRWCTFCEAISLLKYEGTKDFLRFCNTKLIGEN